MAKKNEGQENSLDSAQVAHDMNHLQGLADLMGGDTEEFKQHRKAYGKHIGNTVEQPEDEEDEDLEDEENEDEDEDQDDDQDENDDDEDEDEEEGDDDQDEDDEDDEEDEDEEDDDEDADEKKGAKKSKKEKTPAGKKSKEKSKRKDDDEDEEDENEDEDDEDSDDEDPWGLNKSKGKKSSLDEVVLDKKVLKAIKSDFGVNDGKTFFKSAKSWRRDAQQLPKVKEELESVYEDLSKMPPRLAEPFNLWAKGEDWEAALNRERIDFNHAFEKQDKQAIVVYYHKEAYEKLQKKLQEEKITQEDFEERVDELHSSAKPLYASSKKAFESHRDALVVKAENDRKAVKESISVSVDNLRKELPEFKTTQLQSVRQSMINGDISGPLVMDKNGRFLPDAAKKIALLKFGDSILKHVKQREQTKGRNKATEDYIHKADKHAKNKKSRKTEDQTRKQTAVKHLDFQLEKNPYA